MIESSNFIPSNDDFHEFLAKCKRSDNELIMYYYFNISKVIKNLSNSTAVVQGNYNQEYANITEKFIKYVSILYEAYKK